MADVLYLTTLECPGGHETTFAHEGPWAPADLEGPWPEAEVCPRCGAEYGPDIGAAVVDERLVAEVAERPELPPEEW